jgi:Inorganic pyrophosphatase
MANFINLPPFTEHGDMHVIVETPRGSRAKFAYDPKLETFALSKSLLSGPTYPHDWGFVPSPKAMTAIRSTSRCDDCRSPRFSLPIRFRSTFRAKKTANRRWTVRDGRTHRSL